MAGAGARALAARDRAAGRHAGHRTPLGKGALERGRRPLETEPRAGRRAAHPAPAPERRVAVAQRAGEPGAARGRAPAARARLAGLVR